MVQRIDIRKSSVINYLDSLLKDMNTGENIIWATDVYSDIGDGFQYLNHIVPSVFTSSDAVWIENAREQDDTVSSLPLRLCNKKNNSWDKKWFGKKNVFNREKGERSWKKNENKIIFPEDRTWKDYVSAVRFEPAYEDSALLTSRFDSATEKRISPVLDGIGILDRKLRVVDENTFTEDDWIVWSEKAYQSIYAYEYRGDDLLFTRVNMLMTYFDYYKDLFDKEPSPDVIEKIVKILDWNIWQMDKDSNTPPLGKPYIDAEQMNLFGENKKRNIEPVSCKIKNWKNNKTVEYRNSDLYLYDTKKENV